jgi:hypothetical protein
MILKVTASNQLDVSIHNRGRSFSEVQSPLCHEFPDPLEVLFHKMLNAAHKLDQMIANLC